MAEESQKEVYFFQYCPLCRHQNLDESDEPCDECLASPVNVDSHKPVRFEEP